MKKVISILLFVFPLFGMAQNVGIGITTPTEKLHIKNPLRSTVKISSNSFSDTTELLLSNRDNINQGTDFSLKSMREEGLFLSSLSDLPGNTSANSIVVRPNGNVGIGILPASKLDINGGVRLQGLNFFEFGAGVAGKEVNAGKIGYNGFGQSAMTFVGGGTNATNRAFYFYGEGGTTFSGPMTITGNTNIGGQVQLNGSPGTAGQVLTSNGTSDPSWKNSSFGNTTRFAVHLIENASINGNSTINRTDYNLNPSDIVIGASTITVNHSGLYHFDIGAYGSLNFTSATSSSPAFGTWFFFGLPNSMQVVNSKTMQPSSSANTFFSLSEKVSLDVYIAAPATISVYHTFNTLGIGGGASTHNFEGFLAGYLISD